MEFKQEISQSQSQQLVLSLALRQSIEILGLSSQELAQRIQTEILENPVLEETNEESEDIAIKSEALKQEKNKADTDASGNKWEEQGLEQAGSSFSSVSEALEKTERKHQFIQNAVHSQESLGEHLLWQLRMSPLDKEEQVIGETIISAIDERGLLIHSLRDLFPDGEQKQTERALETIQSFDPLACGSRTVAEALLVQARHHRAEDKISQRILENYFPELERLDFEKIEKETGIGWEEIQKSLHFIQSLEPYPGRLYAQGSPEYILPDIIVREREGELYLILNDDWLPGLKITEDYESMFEKVSSHSHSHSKNKEWRYLKDKFNSAQMLIQSIHRRRQTLLQVSQKIVEHQKNFFLKGPQYLEPLILETIAQSIEIHSSTVSRTIANKYLQCQWGYFKFKYFFSAKLKSTSASQSDVATQNIKERLRLLIHREEEISPLSDQELLSIFQKEGVQIARRTIAKYRKIMKIPAGRTASQNCNDEI